MEPITTERLLLVPMATELHYGAMRRMNGDLETMRYILGKAETPLETKVSLARAAERWQTQGHSWYAVMHQSDVVGAVTLQHLEAKPENPFEIGWRFPKASHGQGFATEAAQALLMRAPSLGIDTVYAVADPRNLASLAVMRRIGMKDLGLQIHYDREVATFRWTAAQPSPE
jgi:RimJ/RimL family protein N-acetyltransferase